jgi:nitroreductase
MIIEEIVKRRSIRKYLPAAVEEEVLMRILEAGRKAPTSRNAQQWRIIIVNDPGLKARIVDEASPHQPFLKEAPILLVACGENTEHVMKCGHPAYLIDVSIVLDHISLQAVREGLGTCWIGSFFQEPVKRLLKIPGHAQVVEMMSLGYPDQNPPPTRRKPVEEFYSQNSW